MKRKVIITLNAAFLIALFLPLAQQLTGVFPDKAFSLRENREKAAAPSFPPKDIFSWSQEVSVWFRDHFGFRDFLIKVNNSVVYYLLGTSPDKTVMRGKENWLFYGTQDVVNFYRSGASFSADELEWLKQVYLAKRTLTEQLGAKYMLVVTPGKPAIYPEYYPDKFSITAAPTRLDQLVDYLEKHTDITVVNTKQAVLEVKDKNVLFSPADSHWNDFGALAAYREIEKSLVELFPNISPFSLEGHAWKWETTRQDFWRMVGVFGAIPHQTLKLIPPTVDRPLTSARRNRDAQERATTVRRDNAALIPKALVFRDSFFRALLPFFSQHFQVSKYFSNHFFEFDPEFIAEEKPNLVMEQFVEYDFHFPKKEKLPEALKELIAENS